MGGCGGGVSPGPLQQNLGLFLNRPLFTVMYLLFCFALENVLKNTWKIGENERF